MRLELPTKCYLPNISNPWRPVFVVKRTSTKCILDQNRILRGKKSLQFLQGARFVLSTSRTQGPEGGSVLQQNQTWTLLHFVKRIAQESWLVFLAIRGMSSKMKGMEKQVHRDGWMMFSPTDSLWSLYENPKIIRICPSTIYLSILDFQSTS